ncbi:acyltransferase [Microbulbifer guangxiensis]|uniref:acyltransferase n=1 Tax=Microbulbifer guangxiensis TaxID=2904249 RepID=UPI001F205742|nr:acyltransferase [Microbulbifer guangxiensis]
MRNTTVLLTFAVFLITNSHLDTLYPVPQLGTGGAIGNVIFFFLSGYGLAISWGVRGGETFAPWILRRIVRVYPSVLVVNILFLLVVPRLEVDASIESIFSVFVWPTQFWFISAIIVFYFVIYAVLQGNYLRYAPFIILLLWIPYLVIYSGLELDRFSIEDAGYFKWIHYFQIMLFGAYFSERSYTKRFSLVGAALGVVTCIFFYYGLKVWMIKYDVFYIQFLTHIILYPFLIFAYFLFTADGFLKLFSRPLFAVPVAFVSSHALEIYLLQYFIYSDPIVSQHPFPLNVFYFISILVASSYVVRRSAACLVKLLESRFGNLWRHA